MKLRSLWKCSDWNCGIVYFVDLILGNVTCPGCGQVGTVLMIEGEKTAAPREEE